MKELICNFWKAVSINLTLQAPAPQNGQRKSNNSAAMWEIKAGPLKVARVVQYKIVFLWTDFIMIW